MAVLRDIAPCSHVKTYRRFVDAYCLHHQGDFTSVIALMMEAVRASETSIYFYDTARRHIPEGCHLQINPLYTLFI
jgi:hypothetical protein